ncbi:hypothetical protein BA6E_10643 [Bacteroidales bacterium 6E]|nr:hypothetical protein BA6E_10643 [Bacteroidales bacterium 6E]
MVLPRLFVFNPTCDFAVANGSPSWQPNAMLTRMEEDMATIVRFLATPDDLVLLKKLPSPELSRLMISAGFTEPRYTTFDSFTNTPETIKEIHPWGWSPAFIRQISPFLKPKNNPAITNEIFLWKESDKQLRSRLTSHMLLQLILHKHSNEKFIPIHMTPRICHTMVEIEQFASETGPLMLKSPWSSSGRGLIAVKEIPIHLSIRQQITGALKSQGYIMAEPLLEKVQDLAFLYNSVHGKISFTGISRFFTDNRGQYKGNYLRGFPDETPREEKEFIDWSIAELPGLLIKALTDAGLNNLYSGAFGIDTLIFRDHAGNLRINPCLEINWRFTMGHICMGIEKYIYPSSFGIFRTWQGREKSFASWIAEQNPHHTLCDKSGKILSGFIPLTEFAYNNHFGAWLEVFPKQAKGKTVIT